MVRPVGPIGQFCESNAASGTHCFALYRATLRCCKNKTAACLLWSSAISMGKMGDFELFCVICYIVLFQGQLEL